MKLNVKFINRFCKKEAKDTQEFQALRTQFIASLLVDERYDPNNKDPEQVDAIAKEAIISFPKLNPCERAFLELQVRVFCIKKTVESWRPDGNH